MKLFIKAVIVLITVLFVLIVAIHIYAYLLLFGNRYSTTKWTPKIQTFVESELNIPLPQTVPVQYFFFDKFQDYISELLISVPYSDVPKYIPKGIEEAAPFDSKTEFLGYINSKNIKYSLKTKLKEFEFYKRYSGRIPDKKLHCEVLVLSQQDFETLPSSAPVDVLICFFES